MSFIRWIFERGKPLAAMGLLLPLGVGCEARDDSDGAPNEAPVGTVQQAVAGQDGAVTVTAANTILNQYAVLAADAAVGATSLSVTNISDLNSATFGPLGAGDMIMVVQMQGATIDVTNTAQYGNVTALGNAGRYELVGVTSVQGNTINLDTSCAGLKFGYTAAGRTQVVRVPQVTTLTVNAAASITAPAWDGQRGGVVAVLAQSTATLNGAIDVSARGFRGGAADNNSANPGANITLFRSADSLDGGEKGEGIAGYQAAYTNGRYGRGAPANAGGGGNSHNAGGGGGANAKNLLNSPWTGQGVMNAMVVGAAAWALDPGFIANMNALTASAGGGRGGYTYSANNANALTQGPGNANWGGDNRREVGGLGGRPLDLDPSGRIFFGGGGGAGDGNNNAAGAGGIGGGIVLLAASGVSGTSAIRANGGNGVGTTGGGNDAPGGGGGGGTVLVITPTLTGVSLEAKGGNGGSQNIAGNEAEGPGGGGGGGYVLVTSAALPTVTVAGGTGGTSNSGAVTEFPANGATDGNSGTVTGTAMNLPICAGDTTPPDTSILTFEPNPTNDPTGEFSFGSNEMNVTYECSIDGAAFISCGQTLSTFALGDGQHTIAVRAKDAAGNVDPTPATYTWVVDTTAPDTTIPTAEPNPTNDPTGDFTFGSNEMNVTYECSVDGGAFAVCTQTFSTAALADGSHTISVRAKDAVGNVDPTPATYTWVVDTTPPDTSILTFEPNPTNDPTGEFSFGSNEMNVTYECSIDGAAFIPCGQTLSTFALADGQHTIAVRAKDAAGNVDPTPATYTWVVDSGPPDTTIATAEPNPTNDPTGDFTFTSDDPLATFECSVDGGAFVDCPANFSTAMLGDGQHTIAVRAKDGIGQVDPTPAMYTWTVDTTPPDTSFATAEPNPTNDPSGDFTFASNEMNVTFECSVDGGAFVPCGAAFSTADLADGVHTIAVRAIDAAGNVDPTPAMYTWTVDTDTDNDGLNDPQEQNLGTDPNDADSDDDGVIDGQEPSFGADTDGDGLINALDPDSDNDGLFDGTELGLGCNNPATNPAADQCIPDGDNGATTTDPLDADTDDGTVEDGAEDKNLNGAVDPGETDPTAGNGADDLNMMNTDTDGDGLTDDLELFIGTDPNDADTDNDGVIDGQEPNPTIDTDGDGLINALDTDSDDDGLFDGTELGLDCSNPDTDMTAGTCVADADNGATVTSPIDPDTDDGGVTDGSEDTNKNGAIDVGETDPTVGNGADDNANADDDGDGLTNAVELLIGTNPNDADSDDDGALDGAEANYNQDTDGDGLINALDADSDNDGLFDGLELGFGCSNPDTDTLQMACSADTDPATTTSPLLADTDDGGLTDGVEDQNANGAIDAGETDPNNPADDTMVNPDTDGDGLTNVVEGMLGTNPFDADSDDDGIIDGQETNPTGDGDNDGLINALDADSDNDGLFDGTEIGLDCSHPDTDPTAMSCTPDGDGGATTTDPQDADTDDGSVNDGDEDGNKNGVVDEGETDPNNGADDVPVVPCTTDADCGEPDSGKVCDIQQGECVDGCHTPGNGCPADEVCTSDNETIGQCVECTTDAQCGDDTSGKICDAATFTCVEGCREGGNGCPDGEVCTLVTETVGTCEVIEDDEQVVAQGSGCFCSTPASNDNNDSPWLLSIAVGALVAARRRRRAHG
ncbi:MAG: hypothetical protein IPK82_16325 [Polyangiaceae bacterium]|nr:hypothetical protein [Polyangiaceae bacterium]